MQVYNPVVVTAYPERSPAGRVPEPGNDTLLHHRVRDDTVHLLMLNRHLLFQRERGHLNVFRHDRLDAVVVRRRLAR
jgi:hypothetical protein